MIITVLLVFVLAICLLYGFLHTSRSRSLRLFIVGVSTAGIVLVLAPDLAQSVANTLGVGRGADLVFYCWVVISLAMFLQIQLSMLKIGEQITDLARRIAVTHPQTPEPTQHSQTSSGADLKTSARNSLA